MKLHTPIWILLLFLFECSTLYGQESQQELLDVFPPSPEAAALGKHGELPVSLYRGTPSITIPIYEFNLNDLNLPIRLSYDASGIKVDQIATNIGLGWTLEAGGVITRSIQGSDDGFVGGRQTPSNPSSFNPDYNQDLNDYELAKLILKGDEDMRADEYYYNFLGNSGKFIFNNDKTVAFTIPYRALKIDSATDITDENGVRYIFGTLESQSINENCSGGPQGSIKRITPPQPKSNYLTTVESPSGSQIQLNYESYSYSYEVQGIAQKYISSSSVGGCFPINDRICTRSISVNAKRISSIYSPTNNITVDFSYASEEREDLPGANRLSLIEVKRGSKVLRNFNLEHSFFYSNDYDPNESADQRSLDTRLKLDTVTEEGKPGWIFDYNTTIEMPSRDSFAQDFWGFYNGSNSNSSLIPSDNIWYQGGSNRDLNPNKIQAGLLTQITYPTGGTSNFEYEPHAYTYTGNEDQWVDKSLDFYSTNGDVQNFTMNSYTSDVSFFASLGDPGSGGGGKGGTAGNQSSVRVTFPDNAARIFYPDDQLTVDLPAGSYTVRFMLDYSATTNGSLHLDWEELESVPITETRYSAGLRISSIASQDAMTPSSQVRIFKYSGMVPAKTPRHITDYFKPGSNSNPTDPETYCQYKQLTSAPVPSLGGMIQHTGYRMVKEEYGSNGQFGRIIHKFSTGTGSLSGGSIANRSAADYHYKWSGGIPLEISKEKNIGTGDYVPVEKIFKEYTVYHDPNTFYTDTYSNKNEKSIYNIKVSQISPEYNDGSIFHPAEFQVESDRNISVWFHPSTTIQRKYASDDSTKFVETITDFEYANADHIKLTKLTETNSNGTARTTEYEYAHEISNDGTGVNYTPMRDLNMLSQPYKVTLKDGTGTIKRIDWTLWKQEDGYWLPCSRWIGGPDLGTAAPTNASCN